MMRLLPVAFVVVVSSIGLRADVPTVFSVADSGDGTLRDAIARANAAPGRDTIRFSIAGDTAAIIRPLSQLPPLSDSAGVLIDGFSQPGATPGEQPPRTCILRVVLNGSEAGNACGLLVTSSLNVVRGLSIVGFMREGIRLQAMGPGTSLNLVSANFVGIDANGEAHGNARDITADWSGVSISGTSMLPVVSSAFDNAITSNLISANGASGVELSGGPPTDVYRNTVAGNLIGTDVTGMLAQGNTGAGVLIADGAHENLITGNTIAANGSDGVSVVGRVEPPALQWVSRHNTIAENIIGASVEGLVPMPNRGNGIYLGGLSGYWQLGHASSNTARLNTIAHNGRNGIAVWEHPITTHNADSNAFSWNVIHSNGGLGIDLGDDGPTPNDPHDLDEGANDGQNAPVIDSAVLVAPGRVDVRGSIDVSDDARGISVEVYLARSNGEQYGEGGQFLATVSPEQDGTWLCLLDGLNGGDTLTAIATSTSKSTSEFSRNVVVRSSASAIGAEVDRRAPILNVLTAPSSDAVELRVSMPMRVDTRVTVYDVRGREIALLHDGALAQGEHRLLLRRSSLTHGVYICELSAGGTRVVRKVLL
jgi:hypothetical protein